MPYAIAKLLGPKVIFYFAGKGYKWAIEIAKQFIDKDEPKQADDDFTPNTKEQ